MATGTSGLKTNENSCLKIDRQHRKFLAGLKMIIQCDFDGTITVNNMSVLIRERFAPSQWRGIESEYLQRRLTVEQSNQQQYALLRESREELHEFVRQAVEFKPGFLPFIEFCRTAGIRFVIVSSGLDFYIEAELEEIGAPELELYCARASFNEDGIGVTYFDPEGNIIDAGFKKSYLGWLKKQGNPIVYIGDGLSDFEAASAADYIFATHHLHRLLTESAVAHYTFTDFDDIKREISNLRSD
jgi:2-hydroxy-3-keto-5-methylthiopentenyl-1-phosphate phosphatase